MIRQLSCCYLLFLFVTTSSASNVTTATPQSVNSTIGANNGNISDFMEIMETPPPVMEVEEGENLKLFLLFTLKTTSVLTTDNEFVLSMRRETHMRQLYRCQGVEDNSVEEAKNLDCYCVACHGRHGDSNKLVSDHRIYEMRQDKVTRIEMMVMQMEKTDNGTVYTMTMGEQTIYETQVRCKTSTASERYHHIHRQVIAFVVVALVLMLIIVCTVRCILNGSPKRTARVVDEEKPPPYTTEKVVLRGPRDMHQQSRAVSYN